MNPNTAGQSMTLRIKGALGRHGGLGTSFTIVDNLWKIDSITTLDASPLLLKFGGYFRPFDFRIKDNQVNFTLDFYYTHRMILGDFSNGTRILDGTEISERGFNGLDVSANIYLSNVQMFVQYSRNSKKDLIIPGFSGSQVSFGVNVTGEFLKLK